MILFLISREPNILIGRFHTGAMILGDSLPTAQAFELHLGKTFQKPNLRLSSGYFVIPCPTLVAQDVSACLTGHILEALLPQVELKE